MTFSSPTASIVRATFTDLSACLYLPAGAVRAFALFAHYFTCSKDVLAAKRIAAEP
jgi:putative redox protein